ncbi:MAG: SpoIIE family protein phosphatase [Bacteroidales bacterium]|nr:SpoIIE family protein phosphatase [Bacteroidales bacterium]
MKLVIHEVRNRQILLTLALLMMIPLPRIHSQQYRFMEYGLNDGLPQPYVYTVGQDVSGYLWVGTGEGVARFDGKTFQVFTTSDSLSDNFVTASHTNKSGVWFGHMNGGVSLFNGQQLIKVLPGDPSKGSITGIKSMNGTTWASTQSGGIWTISSNLQATLYADPENMGQVLSFELLSSNECLVGSIDGVYAYAIVPESRTLRLIGTLDGLPETEVQDLKRSRDKQYIYILTQDEGIYTFNTEGFNLEAAPLTIETEKFIEGPQQIYEDSEMNLWVPTFGEGMYKLIRDSSGHYTALVNYNEENGLPGNNVKFIFQDREENIWIGMYGTGLARLVDEAYVFSTFDDPKSNSIHSIYINEQYRWYGTENGMMRVDRSDGTTKLFSGKRSGLPDDEVITSICESSEGDIWIGTKENGIFRLLSEGEKFDKYHISSGTLENSINAINIKDSLVWIATEKGVCKINRENGTRRWFTISNAGLPHNQVNHLQADEDGRLWLSTMSNTVAYIENDSVTRMVIPLVGGVLNIRSITTERNGNIWVGTYGNGIFKIEGDSAFNLTTADGLLSDYCYSLLGDDNRYIWVSHRGGLSRIRLLDGFISTFKEEVGIDRNMEFNVNAVFKEQSGVLWFGSKSGVLAYDPRLEKSQPPPALSISSVMVNDMPYEAVERLELPPGRHDIRIQFMGVNLKNPAAVSYQYKMEGLGNVWSEAFTENQVVFNKLPNGKYTFELRAMNREGVFNDQPVALYMVIAKPIWKRGWFYALITLAVSMSIILYIKRREHNLLMEKQLLEERIRERTEEVVKQKEEIEIQRDAIKSQNEKIELINKNITDSITYASRIQQAVFIPPEELERIFPKSFVLNRPQYIVSGDFFWIAQKENKLVVTVADCTGHGVPGAFMSMLGITLLNEQLNTHGIEESHEILNKLKLEIINALRQKDNRDSTSDGMDMALCVYDPDSSKLQYSGGFSPLALIRNGEIEIIKADPMPVGIGAIVGREFTKHDIEIEKGDLIYLYTDGYEDQFGGEEDKKFSRKRFRELLLSIHSLPMPDQKSVLENRLDEWMDGSEQIDDITVMGIRF